MSQAIESQHENKRRFEVDRHERLISVRCNGVSAGELGVDEALRVVAVIIFGNGKFPRHPESMDRVSDSLFVEEVSHGQWTIFSRDGRFCGHLDDGECLYFLFHWCMQMKLPWGGWKSYEDVVSQWGFLQTKPVALLEHIK